MAPTLPRERFASLCQRLGLGPAADAVFEALAMRLAEPHRAYHNAVHIAACLRHFDGVRDRFAAPDEAEFALWWHDAIYDPRAPDNEARSADLARAFLSGAAADRVAALILATKHDAPPAPGDAELVVDIDLAILGAPAAEFAAYDAAIRREYSWVPEARFRTGRTAVLRGFLARPAIYRTALFHAKLEAPARLNLDAALAALADG
jgi:predicted metal-dependent HD superfamily phosphohydrolase